MQDHHDSPEELTDQARGLCFVVTPEGLFASIRNGSARLRYLTEIDAPHDAHALLAEASIPLRDLPLRP
jgi:hypothetical protein